MSLVLQTGKHYLDRSGYLWTNVRRARDDKSLYLATREIDRAECTFWPNGAFQPIGRELTVADTAFDLVTEKPDADAVPDVKASILAEAGKIVNGARRSAYGTPERNFERIARFWQAYFENTGRGDVKITAADVSPLMRLMKEARLCESPQHRDSFVDIIGYAMTGAEVNGVPADA